MARWYMYMLYGLPLHGHVCCCGPGGSDAAVTLLGSHGQCPVPCVSSLGWQMWREKDTGSASEDVVADSFVVVRASVVFWF